MPSQAPQEFSDRPEPSTVRLSVRTFVDWLKAGQAFFAIIGVLSFLIVALLATRFQTIDASSAQAAQTSAEIQDLRALITSKADETNASIATLTTIVRALGERVAAIEGYLKPRP